MFKSCSKILCLITAVPAFVLLSACSESAPQTRTEAVEQLQALLNEVRDTASADSAAEKYRRLIAEVEKLPEVSKEEAAKAKAAVGSWIGQILRLEKENFYDSEALKKALNSD